MILVIAGDKSEADWLSIRLQERGYCVEVVPWRADFEPVHDPQPALIIVDASTGAGQILKTIRHVEGLRNQPIIVLTDPRHFDERMAQELGLSLDVLPIPFSWIDLEKIIRKRFTDTVDEPHKSAGFPFVERRHRDRRQGERRHQFRHDYHVILKDVAPANRLPTNPPGEPIKVLIGSDRAELVDRLVPLLAYESDITLINHCVRKIDELVDLVMQGEPDILLLDTALLEQLGAECLTTLRSVDPHLKILLLFEDLHPVTINEIESHGICGCLPAYALPHQYIRAIREVMHGALWLPRRIIAALFQRFMIREGLDADSEEGPGASVAALLTLKEKMIIRLVASGMSNKEIAKLLHVSPDTIKKHLKTLFDKLGVHRRSELAYSFARSEQRAADKG